MPSDDILTDDYVAELLAKEASDCSLKYSAMGLDAYKTSKRPANQPKPNTRFLNNIIRDTNHHNRTLLAKENAESQARLRELDEAEKQKQREEDRKVRRMRPGLSDTRKRMLGDIAAHLGGPSKKRKTEAATAATAAEGPVSKSEDWNAFADSHHQHRPGSDRRTDTPQKASDAKVGSSSKELGAESSGAHRNGRASEKSRVSSRRDRDADDSVHPLDDIIGPAPASASEPVGVVRRRGRGANVNRTSGIDSRFAADYDPRLDVTPEPDDDNNDNDVVVNHQPTNSTNTNTNTKNNNEENWDNAVEAFRDRLKWNQQGAERLRSAGFTEDEIRKWEKGGKKDESDVRWNKQGGLREWDKGKVVGDDGRSWCRPRRSGGG
ncbi:putative pre-mrna-splicing factor 38b protein [Eutypa lata UCREL1]|uniref:Putative pre-mrna-splicing factor 38b protein n=1 Tax=Eutypa lata (strain UCR-EL1) TaxID=1287681 RepID=M7TH55_EUTLA|nr:putative pre-mrna-splicing factor 38b protein [Eutypa lata UCREL1]